MIEEELALIRRALQILNERDKDALPEVAEHYKIELEEVIPAGDSYLVMLVASGRGHGSGIKFRRSMGQLWVFKDGLVWQVTAYETREAARAAAGLAT